MNLLPLAQLIDTAGVGTMGQTIFVNMLPADCSRAVLLRQNNKGTKIDYELPGYYKTEFQLIVRASGYADGDTLMTDATAALTIIETLVDTAYFRYIRPKMQPVVFPLSKGGLLELLVEFEAVFDQ